jgi:transcriptional regulator with XRE-family HTH domain
VKVPNPLSERIKTLREKRGWTQQDLATRLGVEQSTVSRWERDMSRPLGVYLSFLERLLAGRRVRK